MDCSPTWAIEAKETVKPLVVFLAEGPLGPLGFFFAFFCPHAIVKIVFVL